MEKDQVEQNFSCEHGEGPWQRRIFPVPMPKEQVEQNFSNTVHMEKNQVERSFYCISGKGPGREEFFLRACQMTR